MKYERKHLNSELVTETESSDNDGHIIDHIIYYILVNTANHCKWAKLSWFYKQNINNNKSKLPSHLLWWNTISFIGLPKVPKANGNERHCELQGRQFVFKTKQVKNEMENWTETFIELIQVIESKG